MRIDRVTDVDGVQRAALLFDRPPRPAATADFLAAAGHHLLVAYATADDDSPVGDAPARVDDRDSGRDAAEDSDRDSDSGATDGDHPVDRDGIPVGMVTGVEMTHPDKGTEMFVYELGVTPGFRRRGVATALLRALGDLARSRGCYGMWVAVDIDDTVALATYARAGARDEGNCAVRGWTWRTDDPT